MDPDPTPEQLALRADAAAFAEGLRPLLEADPEWRRQGMLSDGDSREVTRELGRAGWIGMTWPDNLGRRGLTHVDAALAEDVLGYHWLPLSLYLLSYKTVGCALERFGSPELRARPSWGASPTPRSRSTRRRCSRGHSATSSQGLALPTSSGPALPARR